MLSDFMQLMQELHRARANHVHSQPHPPDGAQRLVRYVGVLPHNTPTHNLPSGCIATPIRIMANRVWFQERLLITRDTRRAEWELQTPALCDMVAQQLCNHVLPSDLAHRILHTVMQMMVIYARESKQQCTKCCLLWIELDPQDPTRGLSAHVPHDLLVHPDNILDAVSRCVRLGKKDLYGEPKLWLMEDITHATVNFGCQVDLPNNEEAINTGTPPDGMRAVWVPLIDVVRATTGGRDTTELRSKLHAMFDITADADFSIAPPTQHLFDAIYR